MMQSRLRDTLSANSLLTKPFLTKPLLTRPSLLFTGLLSLIVLSSYTAAPLAHANSSTKTPAQTTSKKAPATQLKPFSVVYKAEYDGLPFGGKATRSLKINPDNPKEFVLTTKAKTFLMKLNEESRFQWDADQCVAFSHLYEYARSGIGKNKKFQIEFDHDLNRATYIRKDKADSFIFDVPLSDRLTEQLVVRCHVQQGKKEIKVHLARKDKVITHLFRQVGVDLVTTPLGTFESIKVERIHKDPERSTLMWFAIKLNYELIKLEQVDDGKHYSIMAIEAR